MVTCIFISLQSHTITELSALEGTQKDHWVQLLSEFSFCLDGGRNGEKADMWIHKNYFRCLLIQSHIIILTSVNGFEETQSCWHISTTVDGDALNLF